jgi:hypothetical protein
MSKLQQSPVLMIISGLFGLILCAGLALTGGSGGVAYWLLTGDGPTPGPTRRPAVIAALPTATLIPPTATATETPAPTATPPPTETPAPTPPPRLPPPRNPAPPPPRLRPPRRLSHRHPAPHRDLYPGAAGLPLYHQRAGCF